jgi:hypothetical protein
MDELLHNESIHRFEAALEDLRDCTTCARLLEQMETQRRESQASLTLIYDQFAELKSTLSSNKGSTEQWLEKQAAWEAARDKLEQDTANLRGELEQATTSLAANKIAEDDAAKRMAALETQVKVAEERLLAKELELQNLERELDSASSASAAQANLQEEVARLQKRLAELETEATQREAVGKSATDALQEARGEIQRLRDEASGTEARLEELEALRTRVEEMEKLQPVLQEERKQRAAAEQRLNDEMARGTKTMLAQQLTEALREAEEAKEELRRLRDDDTIFAAIPAPAPRVEVPAAAEEFELESSRSAPETGATPQDEEDRLAQEAQIHAVLKQMRPGQKRSIGEILLDAGVITAEQLEEALEDQKLDPHHHLGAILIERGWVSEESVARVLASQVNAPFVELKHQDIEPSAVALLSGRLANQHTCVPIRYTDDRVTVAMVNPMDLVAIEDLERATGRGVDVVVSTGSQIQELIEAYYGEAIA